MDIAKQLTKFLHNLQSIDTKDGPVLGRHNFYRGAHLSHYSDELFSAAKKLHHHIDVHNALALWKKAVNAEWLQNPIWLHGDLSSGNMLIQQNRLSAIIDFGCMAIGDPACDLAIAWTFFEGKSRQLFQSKLNLDEACWLRARGWVLWKTCITLCQITEQSSIDATAHLDIIKAVLDT